MNKKDKLIPFHNNQNIKQSQSNIDALEEIILSRWNIISETAKNIGIKITKPKLKKCLKQSSG
jgi:capsular polysaccharide biosynthesis protein